MARISLAACEQLLVIWHAAAFLSVGLPLIAFWNDIAGAQWEHAQHIFRQMLKQGCVPDVVTYTALISTFERGGQWQLAYKVRGVSLDGTYLPTALVGVTLVVGQRLACALSCMLVQCSFGD